MPDQQATTSVTEFDIKAKRLALQATLESILGSKNVYFQPPYNINLSYPCIIYNRISGKSIKADNKVYNFYTQYEVKHITMDPDEFIFPEMQRNFSHCSYDRHFVADRLHHNVYTIYI